MIRTTPARFSSTLIRRTLLLALALGAMNVSAQTQDSPNQTTPNQGASGGQITTLHVETNLIEVPVLVLTAERERLPYSIAASRFTISLGGGPWVHPKYVRREGDDPIDLAIVIDPRDPQISLFPRMGQALADISPLSLTTRDHVSIYVMGCAALQIVPNIPPDPKHLRDAMDSALAAWTNKKEKPSCKPSTQLWDALAVVIRTMSTKPGRRTILAVTNGEDHKSHLAPEDLAMLAQANGVTIFGLNPTAHPGSGRGSLLRTTDENLLSLVTESSGGVTLGLQQRSLDKALKLFVQMLRERYIVQFPRPSDAKAGKTEFAVNVTGPDLFIRTAGKSVPLPDPVAPTDATTANPTLPQ